MPADETLFDWIDLKIKRRMLLVLPVAIPFLGSLGHGPAVGKSPANKPNLKTVILPVEGMFCPVCVVRVRRTLKLLDGVLNVEVSLEQQAARVTFDVNKLSADQLVAAVNKLGYKAGTPREVE